MLTKSELREAIPDAIRRRISEVLADYENTIPEWRWIKDQHDQELAMARSGWARWRPTQLLNLETRGPGRKVRNWAAEVLRDLERDGVIETAFRDGSDRCYAVRLISQQETQEHTICK